MEQNVREVIKNISKNHLKMGYLLFGQCLTAVGWVGGTVPELTENDGLVELPMADVADGGFVVGAALMGKRPIYIVRYQGFQWFNAPIICNYAGKSKELWKTDCPIFIRSIAMEGGVGPVASSSHHGIFYRMPGIKIASPMTPKEYRIVYEDFMQGTDTVYVSEHRKSYDNTKELLDITCDNPDIVLFPISVTRFEAIKVANQMPNISVHHILWINPFQLLSESIDSLRRSRYGGIVLDDDYPNGVAKQIAYQLMMQTQKPVYVLALKEKVAGFQQNSDNYPPSCEEIIQKINSIKSS
jgi:hypothetical protein